jgi:hypothetical protein
METSVEQLIKERSTFASLSGEELEMVKELCETEEEFQAMKQFFHELENVSASRKTIINPEVKNSLDTIFSAKHPGLRANWTAPEMAAAPLAPVIPLHRRTWVRIAAAAILILGTVPFWNMLRNELPANDTKTTAQLQPPPAETDTKNPAVTESKDSGPAPAENNEQETAPDYADVAADNSMEQAAMEPTVSAGIANTYTWSVAPMDSGSELKVTDGVSKDKFAGYSNRMDVSRQTYGSTAPAASFGFSADVVAKEPATLSSRGLDADLHPDAAGTRNAAVNALSLADQPDVLDLLVPAF